MSRCLDRATLVGHLGAGPEIRTLPGGGRVAHVTLATTRRWNDLDGKPREKTRWHHAGLDHGGLLTEEGTEELR